MVEGDGKYMDKKLAIPSIEFNNALRANNDGSVLFGSRD